MTESKRKGVGLGRDTKENRRNNLRLDSVEVATYPKQDE